MTPPDAALPCWHYAPAPHDGVELAHWQGTQVPLLQPHFHRQTQLSCAARQPRRRGRRSALRTAGRRLPRDPGGRGASRPRAHARGYGLPQRSTRRPNARARPACSTAGARCVEWHEPVSRIARRLGLGREAFTRRFAAQTGLPPHASAAGRPAQRRARAGRGDTELADLALELGFTDQSHPGRHFRRVFGVSPGRYRRHAASLTNVLDRSRARS